MTYEIATLTDEDLGIYNLENLDTETKQQIATKLGDAYYNHMFEESLKAVLEEMNLI